MGHSARTTNQPGWNMNATARIEREGHVAVSDHVRFRQFDDELVLIDLAGGEYFSLNGVGTKIWHAAAAGNTPAQIAASLVGEYDVEGEVALTDCLQLLDRLLEQGLVTKASP
jgi:hypothetical protein